MSNLLQTERRNLYLQVGVLVVFLLVVRPERWTQSEAAVVAPIQPVVETVQSLMAMEQAAPANPGPFQSEAVSVTTGETTICEILVQDYQKVAVEVVNSGAGALTDFQVQLQDHESGEWYPAFKGTDYTSAISQNLYYVWADEGTPVSPSTLASGTTTHIKCFADAYKMRFVATSASTSSVLVRGCRLKNKI